ncbi:MAG TPA: hypothetical protein VEJ40_00085 [Pseudolabrys sp.]|nr:hypothetical protein [Pseudolabrys sp.]
MSLPAEAHIDQAPGRMCPADYRYQLSVFARDADFACDTLYVVGGLYGNHAALAAIEALAARERATPQIVFNGDFHWFDAEPGWFEAIERGVSAYRALRGNVETEIARADDINAGCGCSYPDSFGEDVVRRSNEILRQLQSGAGPTTRTRLRALPMHLVAQVDALRIGIVHGDAQSLAGWQFAGAALDDARNRGWFDTVRATSRIDVFASTHTCDAALRDFALPSGRLTVANNGAAGMPTFKGARFGVITRIGMTPSPHQPLYGLKRGGVHIDAVAVPYNHAAFTERFLTRWPKRSSAYESYYARIVDGPAMTLAQAVPR